jgi:hypothetical protein
MKRKFLGGLLALLIPASFATANMSCGIPPIPPIGCHVGPCVCDARGMDCHYEFVCN